MFLKKSIHVIFSTVTIIITKGISLVLPLVGKISKQRY